jgi:hypothetical protein
MNDSRRSLLRAALGFLALESRALELHPRRWTKVH